MGVFSKRYAHKWRILALCVALVALLAISGIG